jgi:hypothetical protein
MKALGKSREARLKGMIVQAAQADRQVGVWRVS